MKTSTSIFTQVTTENMKNLTTVVAETLAPDVNVTSNKKFAVVDLWNIQKQRRSFTIRRGY